MPSPKKTKGPEVSGVILSFEEASRLQQDPKYKDSLKPTWGFGPLAWTPFQRKVLTCTADEIGLFGGKGGGKAQPLDSKVHTPYGPKRMGDIKVGDFVSNPDGTNAQVIQVHPQGVQAIFRVEFSDGTNTLCTGDHLWLARATKPSKITRNWVHDKTATPTLAATAKVYTTAQLMEKVSYYKDPVNRKELNGWQRRGYQVPLCEPLRYAGRNDRIMDPYVLGLALGDGSFSGTGFTFTTSDQEIIDEVKRRGYKVNKHQSEFGYSIFGVYAQLREYGLTGKQNRTRSEHKFIPKCMFRSSVEDRLDLMAGLLDTDGYVDTRGHVSFTSVSKQLAEGVAELARGLGARASISLKEKTGYRKPDGTFVPCLSAYTVQINTPLVHSMFKLRRKLERLSPASTYTRWKTIERISPEGEAECQCITVDHPNSLYITDDFTVTHNSAAMRAWLIKGNPELPERDADGTPNLTNISYMFCPGYRALILRKNQEDLEDFIARAIEMYRPYNIHFVNGQFKHPCGATIDCGHMKDRNSWQQFIGVEFVRVAIDEAPLIPDYESYDQLRSCQRTVFPELRIQTLLAGNAGGPGTGWISDRFMNAKDATGRLIPPGEIITEDYIHPLTLEKRQKTRVFLFSTYKDNPTIAKTDYIIQLMSLSDKRQRAAYIDGDWGAFTGSYFDDVFRKEARPGEPPHACHVVKTKPVQPRLENWFPRALGVDWGYRHESSCLWMAQHGVTGQNHIYREMVASQMSAERLGFEIGKASMQELNAHSSHAFPLYLSHDAFQQRDERQTLAELLARGIARVLGPNAVHTPDLVIRQMQERLSIRENPSPQEMQAQQAAFDAIRKQKNSGITIRVAPKANSVGWQYLRELMRWEHIQVDRPEFSQEVYLDLLMQSESRAQEYLQYCQGFNEETLPKLLVWDTCPSLIEAIPRGVYDSKGTEGLDKAHFKGRDSLDSLYYLMVSHREHEAPEPYEAFRDKALNAALAANPNLTTQDKIWINRGLEEEWNQADRDPISYTHQRGGRPRRTRVM